MVSVKTVWVNFSGHPHNFISDLLIANCSQVFSVLKYKLGEDCHFKFNWGLAAPLSTNFEIFYLCLPMHSMAPYWRYVCNCQYVSMGKLCAAFNCINSEKSRVLSFWFYPISPNPISPNPNYNGLGTETLTLTLTLTLILTLTLTLSDVI